jgi:hypothetical protein
MMLDVPTCGSMKSSRSRDVREGVTKKINNIHGIAAAVACGFAERMA